jgi:hypothetical protein
VKQAGAEGLRHEELTQTDSCFGFVRESNRSLGKNTSVSNERAIRLSRAAHTTSLREWNASPRPEDDRASVQIRRSPLSQRHGESSRLHYSHTPRSSTSSSKFTPNCSRTR